MWTVQTVGLGMVLCTIVHASAISQTPTQVQRTSTVVAGSQKDTSQPQDVKGPPPAQELINEALKVAKASNKTILVHFSASWCGPCKQFDNFLHAPEVVRLMADHYVTVALTALERSAAKQALENPGADSLMKAAGGNTLPFWYFLEADGKMLAPRGVFPPSTAPRMTEADRAQLRAHLQQAFSRKKG